MSINSSHTLLGNLKIKYEKHINISTELRRFIDLLHLVNSAANGFDSIFTIIKTGNLKKIILD